MNQKHNYPCRTNICKSLQVKCLYHSGGGDPVPPPPHSQIQEFHSGLEHESGNLGRGVSEEIETFGRSSASLNDRLRRTVKSFFPTNDCTGFLSPSFWICPCHSISDPHTVVEPLYSGHHWRVLRTLMEATPCMVHCTWHLQF